MTYGVKLWVRGDFACFTRPELKSERVSYDVMTPSAARGILEAIHWKPAIRWVVDRIHVLEPIKFQTFRRNEVGVKIPVAGGSGVRAAMRNDTLAGLGIAIDENRQPRQTIALRDVAYVIEAHFEMTDKKGDDDTPAKHYEMFTCREFVADFELIDGDMPPSKLEGTTDLGWMLYDIDFAKDKQPTFFRAHLNDGILDVAAAREEGLVS